MLRIALLCLALSGLRAAPLAPRVSHVEGLAGEFRHSADPSPRLLPDDYRQGIEPARRYVVDLNTGRVLEHVSEMERRVNPVATRPDVAEVSAEIERHWLDEVEIPVQRSGAGWVRVEEHFEDNLPKGFRQGTERMASIPEGFRQGTEPTFSMPEGFRQGTEPMMSIPEGFRQGTKSISSIPDGFRQGTEPMASIPDGYRQGTEPTFSMPEGFRQGTEPMVSILDGFRQGTEPMMSFPEGFRQGTEHSSMALGRRTPECKGKIIMGRCYQFNPTPLSFKDAQATCRDLAPNSDLASITDGSLHSGLVSMVTKDGEDSPVLTWLGGVVKNQQAQWLDGSEMAYSDWMKGHPNVHSAKPVCLEMFRMDESWWSTVDCEFLRASICSYPVVA